MLGLRFLSLHGLAAALCVLSWSSSASAHGRYPETGQVAFGPSGSGLVLVRATFGVVLSQDGGASWGLICPDALDMLLTEDPAIAVGATSNTAMDARLLVALFGGLRQVSPDGCDVQDAPGPLGNRVVIDVTADSTDAAQALAVTSDGSMSNGVFSSDDGGATFTDASGPLSRILFETIAIAPTDPARVYLSGSFPPSSTNPRRPFVFRSEDGGVTFTEIAFADFGTDDRNIYVEAVDPMSPERVVVRVDGLAQDRLMLSEDGGATFTEILRGPELADATFDATGEHLFAGGKLGMGLHRASRGGAFSDFTQVAPLSIGCLAFHDDQLFACGDENGDGFAVGVSSDLGTSFRPFMHLADAAHALSCEGPVSTASVCASAVQDLRSDLGLDFAPSGPDAAVQGSGGCHVAETAGPIGTGMVWCVALLFGLASRRRVGRHRSRRT